MATVALQIWTGAYPSIANDVTINVYEEDAPLAIIATITDSTSGHPARSWSFPGLNRVNLLFRIFETSGGTIIQQLGADMNVVPGAQSSVNYRATEQIQADVTAGFVSGVNTVTFDGTGGKEDWRGWDISTLNRMGGEGDMRKGAGLDYTWDKNTAALTLQNAGDVYNPNEWFNVDFAAQVNDVTSSVPNSVPLFSTPKVITADYLVSAGADFGGLLIIRPPENVGTPSANYITLTLPDIATVVAGKLLCLEFARATIQQCARILTQAGQPIDWLQGFRGNMYICNQEFLKLYRFDDIVAGSPFSLWRVFDPRGNWLELGEQVADDNIPQNVYNKVMFGDGPLDTQQYARFYNDFVLNLPASEVVNYDDWSTGNNVFLYSLANSANPANAGKFNIPNRSNQFERNTDGARMPGNFQTAQLLSHSHNNGVVDDKPVGDSANAFANGQTAVGAPWGSGGQLSTGAGGRLYQGLTNAVGGTENRPGNVAVRKYFKV